MPAQPTEPIVREIVIAASPETVFEFFVDADKLTRWLATESTLDPRPGGACIQLHEGDDRHGRGPFHMHGEFLEVDPPTHVVFSWGFIEPEIGIAPGSSIVEVTLQRMPSGTRVQLVHRDLPAAEAESHSDGWGAMLDRLARAVSTQARSSKHR